MTAHRTPHNAEGERHAFPPKENPFDALFADPLYCTVKRTHFGYRYRKWKIRRYVPGTGLILDVGSGTAPVSPDLGRTVVADISEEALDHVHAFGKAVTSITDMEFKPAAFDCILCSEVLEHVLDDGKAVEEMRRVLKTDGTLILTVPFQKKYWAEDDEFVGHVRRYDPGELESLLRDRGFSTIATFKLSGMLERWLTLRSLGVYRSSAPARRLPAWFLHGINLVLFWILYLQSPFLRWKTATRILIVAR